jgi:hypothetical protein
LPPLVEFWRERDDNLNGVGRISKEAAFTGDIDHVYVNTLQHRWHCVHVWNKYVVFANERRPMDSWTAEHHHVQHCVTLLRDFNKSWPDERISSILNLKYPACEYGPVAINLSPNEWTADQMKNHYPGPPKPNKWTEDKLKILFPERL